MVVDPVWLQAVRVLAAVLLVAISAAALRHRGSPVAAAFSWTIVSLSAWGWILFLPEASAILSVPPVGQTITSLAAFAAGGSTVVFWFVYVRRYTGHRQYTTQRRVLLMLSPVAIPVGFRLLLATLLPPSGWTITGVFAIISSAMYLYLAALFVLSIYLLFRLTRRYRQIPATQVAVLGIGIAAPALAVLVSTLTRPVENGTTVSILPIDVSSFGFLIGALAFSYAIRTYSLFTTFPDSEYVARDEVLEDLTEPLFILDSDDRILDMNTAATALCQQSAQDTIGKPIDTIFENLSHLPTTGVQRTRHQTPRGPRQFELSASPLQDGDNACLGTTIIARDITAKTTLEQQLAVLTRILRHNLRNDVDTALAYTNMIEDSDVRTQIRAKLNSLAELSTTARDIDAVVSKAHEPRSDIDVVSVVDSVTEQLADEYDNCEIEVTAPAELPLISHSWLLSQLLTELIENALQHNNQSTARVAVIVQNPEQEDGPVTIRISDNGPGIPAYEQAVIQGESETPLKHSSGVGLWLANWIAESLGGELSFAKEEPDGTTVIVTLRSKPAVPSATHR